MMNFAPQKKNLFEDVNDYQAKGGTKAMGESLDRGQVAAFSLWDDVEVNMLWLDSAYPLDKPATDPGVKRGTCPGGETSTPTYVRDNYPNGGVIFTNAAIGEIGSTLQKPPTMAPTPAPCDYCTSLPGQNTPECEGKPVTQCKNMMNYENKCQWLECDTPPSSSPPTKSPVSNPTLAPVAAPTPPVKICKSWCSDVPEPWSEKCEWENCSGCSECDASDENFCCTWDFFHCGTDTFCNENMINCQGSCGGVWMEKGSPAMECIQRFHNCAKDEDNCCPGLSCVGDGDYKQCIDTEVS